MRIGIIGGSGVYDLLTSPQVMAHHVDTPYGEVTARVGEHAGREIVFLPRHGFGHTVPPHRINYRAHVDALRRLGCQCILATNAVGSMRSHMAPGDLALPDQFLDFTKGRAASFFEGGETGVHHVDMTEPYCPALCVCALELLAEASVPVHPAATLVVTEGPRFETPAEIRMFAQLGGDLVGMTGVPEVVLAREAGMCYMSLCVVTNFAAGVHEGPITAGEVTKQMEARLPLLKDFLLQLAAAIPEQRDCRCRLRELPC